jgi:HTH-type transcriptional regulator/antitoxin HipB
MQLRAQTPEQLAALLRGQRTHTGLTQHQAAALVGLLPKTISALESDPGRCSVNSLYKLLSALGLELIMQQKGRATPSASKLEW